MDVRDQLMDHMPRLRRNALALIKNRELADDLVQDTLERALRRIELFQSGTNLLAWLCTIMRNSFANQARKASARATHVSMDDEGVESECSMAINQASLLEIRDFEYALRCLPTEQREVVMLVGLEELSYADTARSLDIPVGTVMSRLSRGRERLRDLMARETSENPLCREKLGEARSLAITRNPYVTRE